MPPKRVPSKCLFARVNDINHVFGNVSSTTACFLYSLVLSSKSPNQCLVVDCHSYIPIKHQAERLLRLVICVSTFFYS
jgi:hypothetical protein